MSEWKKVKIGDLLEQYRNTIYIDDSVEYGQITISSKDGIKYRCSKLGKEIGRKRQFLIDLKTYPHTVIFTRQGLADGSIGIAPMDVDGCIATENMPMFSVNEKIIIIDYLRYFFISPEFKKLVATITPSGSAQKAIHEKELLLLEISIPDLQTQQEIVKKMSLQLQKTEQLSKEIEKQKSYAKLLRQNILQDAIEGKLTADWRKTHPVIKGDPDYDAEALFEQIREEKYHTDSILLTQNQKKRKNGKSLDFPNPCDNEDLPFEIPEGWKWVRLGEISYNRSTGPFGSMLHKSDYVENGIPLINPTNIKTNHIDYSSCMRISTQKYKELSHYALSEKDIILARRGDLSKCGIIQSSEMQICGTGCFFMKLYLINHYFFKFVYQSQKSQKYLLQDSIGQTMDNLNQKLLEKLPFPLPSLAEQKEIITRVEKHLQTVTDLENQITEREQLTKQIMQGILKDAFEEK